MLPRDISDQCCCCSDSEEKFVKTGIQTFEGQLQCGSMRLTWECGKKLTSETHPHCAVNRISEAQ